MENRFETFTVLISTISRSIRRIKTEAVKEYGLKSPHVNCLFYLYKQPDMTAAELCELCEEDKASISRSLLYLEQNGFLCRDGAESEAGARENGKRYRTPLRLTDKGIQVAEYIASRIACVLEQVSAGVSDRDRAALYRALEQINRNLKDICEENGD